MASSAGKTSQSPVGACNGTAIADLASAEQEQYDYQMHTKMCKKIAQLTKVIYSLNTKNEEQEATLQSLRRVAIETQGSLQPTTAQEIEDEEESSFILRTRLLELQAAIEEVEERGQKAEMEHAELVALMSQETSDLRREFLSLQAERETQHKLLQKAQEEKRQLEIECRELQEVKKKEEEERKTVETERRREDEEEKRKYQGECEGRIENLKKELQIMKEEKERAEKEWKSETKEWKLKVKRIEEEQETSRTTLQQSLDEHISQWQQRETENRKFQNATLQQRLRKAESDLEVGEQRLNDSSRRCGKLQERVEELEEAMDEGRRRVNEAEGVAKKAEEELLVAKERLLLQENELQSKSEELMSQSSCQVRVSAEVEELRSQLGRLNIRNKELELQNSGRSNDHARMLKQHADTLSSMRLELQRAHTEEIRRLQQEVENERTKDKLELEEQKKQLQQKMEEEKAKLKEQLRKALEEVIRKHAGEVRHVHALLDAEKTRMLQVEEQIKASGDERTVLEKEREDLRNQLQLSSSEIAKLEVVIERLEREQEEDREMAKEREKERAEAQRQTACGLECVQVREELQKTQEEAAEQKEALQAEISVLQHERDLLQQSNHSTEEKMRLQFEKQFSDQMLELKREKEDEVRKMNQQWQQKVEELQTLLDEKKEKAEGEKERERRYGHGEMERMKQEIQKTRDMNSSLRAQLHSTIQEKERLMQQQLQVVKEEDEEDEEEEKRGWHEREELLRTERLNHQRAIQALETQADEELQSERQRLITQHKLQLDKQKAELTQQHTEWVRQVTQRHMQQIEDLQNEIHTHTQMMALQQDLKQQNRLQSLERQLDEKNSEVQELKRENEDLKANSLRKEHDEQKHKSVCESLEAEGSLRWSNMESVKKEREREHRLEIQTMMSDFNTAQTRLQARIVALETELKEREERGKRRVEDLHTIAKLQDKLSEREQLIKSLMEDMHQLSQHPPLSSNETLKPYDCRTPVGTLTPPAKKKAVDDTIVVDRGPSLTRTQTPTSPHTDRRASVRHSRPPSQELRHQTQLQLKTSYNQHLRTPAEQRVLESDSQKQEWFTKYFSF